MSFIIVIGGTCARELLYTNYLIAAKISALGNHLMLQYCQLKQ